jgi:chromosome segregation ATPase
MHLEEKRTDLDNELTTLTGQYEIQISENTELRSELTERIAEVERLEKNVRNAQSELATSKANAERIKGRLAELEALKTELENDVAELTGENKVLKETNEMLAETVADARKDVALLNQRMTHLTEVNTRLNRRLASMAPAGFTADHFAIVAQNRNDKITARASRADAIKVSFTLSDVPDMYDRSHDLYLVITDFEGLPLNGVATSTASVRTADDVMQVQAADIRKVNVSNHQVVEMSIDPEKDLDPGTYNLVVYADNGFLGATGFQLR